MVTSEVEKLLQRTMGLDAASIGATIIERVLRQRLTACSLGNREEYWNHLQNSPAELQELIESVVVPETWFFRDREAFIALGRAVNEQWLPRHPSGILRILSVPCATGEEAYSLAMTLFDAGWSKERFKIDAIDISERALGVARRAVFGKNSFRGEDLEFRGRYFELVKQGYELKERMRPAVDFCRSNLLGADFLRGQGGYDVIFCRNLLIYFDGEAQRAAIDVLHRLLAEDGLLFVGPAETGLLLNERFMSAKWPLAFAFHKASVAPASVPKRSVQKSEKHVFRSAPVPVSKTTGGAGERPPASPSSSSGRATGNKPTADLARAQRLADEGRLAEASEICEAFLRESQPCAEAFYLLGLVRDVAGDLGSAREYYRKAIYLDPNHHQTLMHLGYLSDKMGDARAAGLFRERAGRVKERLKHG